MISLLLLSCALAQDPVAGPAPATAVRVEAQDELEAELDRLRERERALLARVAALESQLRAEKERSFARQQEWIAFTRVLQGFEIPALPAPPEFIAEALVTPRDPAADAIERTREQQRRRGAEVSASLRTLLTAEGVRGFDLLEVGLLTQHQGRTWTGPVVARLLDERGRMVGMLKAARLRLEVSRSSRTVTLILEEGYEARGGVRRPFEGGVVDPAAAGDRYAVRGGAQRIFIGAVDPEPWVEQLPELVDPLLLAGGADDGLWNLDDLRVQLVRLLHEAAQAGDPRWRLVGLAGVRGSELRDVQLAELDPVTGRAGRRVFADSLRIRVREGGGVELLLEGGTVRRGTRVAPFLGGRYRIVLPRADAGSWRDATLPGLAAPPLRPAASAADPGGAGGSAPPAPATSDSATSDSATGDSATSDSGTGNSATGAPSTGTPAAGREASSEGDREAPSGRGTPGAAPGTTTPDRGDSAPHWAEIVEEPGSSVR